jgi:hypothetical protein
MAQQSEDYKIVFISSDSSRDSEVNTSVEDDGNGHHRSRKQRHEQKKFARQQSAESSKASAVPAVVGEFIEDGPEWDALNNRPQNPMMEGGRSRVQQPYRLAAYQFSELVLITVKIDDNYCMPPCLVG